ncbi:MAG TPA: serine hydrolase [Ktedonobacteraceae bacterium]|nr:serine hydrolase [Ktedonobacteraceae bacterium]
MKRYVIATVLLVLALEILIATAFLSLTPTGSRVLSAFSPTPTPTPAPVLTAEGTPPAVKATAMALLDAETGRLLASTNAQKRLPMASTTKIMTAVVTLETANLDQMVTIHQDALDEVTKNQGSSAHLVLGDQIRLRDLLYALLLPSGDDAAIAIADAVSGSSAGFVQTMNKYAGRLHLKNTHYINPDGLTYYVGADGKPDPNGKPQPGHYTTAADLAQLTRYALQNPLFAQIVQLQTYDLPVSPTHHRYTWTTTDDLLTKYPGAIGVKTGFTVEAGYCLVFAGTTSTHRLIGVLLGDGTDTNQRFVDATALLNWGFALPLKPPPTPAA